MNIQTIYLLKIAILRRLLVAYGFHNTYVKQEM